MSNKAAAAILSQAAEQLQASVHAMGDYAHVTIRAERGHLVVYIDDDELVARLTPLGDGQYGLSFRAHTGRWEQTPFTGELSKIATTMVDTLGPYLDKYPA